MDDNIIELSEITRCRYDVDSIVLAEKNGHILWCSELFLHCSSMAAWQQYEAFIKNIPEKKWQKDVTDTEKKWSGCEGWDVFKDAVDRLYCHLRDKDIPLNNAIIRQPKIVSREGSKEFPYCRGRAALSVYVRLDYNEINCTIQMRDTNCIDLDSGAMAVVSGFKNHRIKGDCVFLHFDVELPTVARNQVLSNSEKYSDGVSDSLIFYAATASPMNNVPPEISLIEKKLEWLKNRAFRRFRNEDCPVVKKFLIENVDPLHATLEEKEKVLKYGLNSDLVEAKKIKVIDNIKVLTPGQCKVLKDFVDNHISSAVIDTVDDMPEYQVDLSTNLLSQLLDEDTTKKVLALPRLLDSGFCNDQGAVPTYSIFLRLYSAETRPFIAFHHDICCHTCVIALNDESNFEGGSFVHLVDDLLQRAPWKEGYGLLHSGNLVHGVSKITKGKRYSLVVFMNT